MAVAIHPTQEAAARAALGLMRFGLGPRPGDLAEAAHDPAGYLRAELSRPDLPPALPLPTHAALLTSLRTSQKARKGGQEVKFGEEIQQVFLAEAGDRIDRALQASAGIRERLVAFWSNHFAVSADRGPPLRLTAGAFEREAIRPHVLGRFSDLLLAVERHPAMLIYLDNVRSFGPDSMVGQRKESGLNENLGREILELHTLGVDGGYTQADVTSLARILTGWSVARQGEAEGEGEFRFRPFAHEPGPVRLLGRSYGSEGEAQGARALAELASHPATARHLARKLAVHFVSDRPPPPLVALLERTFRESGGDLRAVTLALLSAPAAWEEPATRLRSPWEFTVAALRATAVSPRVPAVLRALHAMGQPLWSPGAPAGFPDGSEAWLAPQGIATRVDVAGRIADLCLAHPVPLAEQVLGPLLKAATRTAISRAADESQGLALLLLSPEFQRR